MPLDLSLDEGLPRPTNKPPGTDTTNTTSATTTDEHRPHPTAFNGLSPEAQTSALSAILSPERQLKAAVELQISQLHNLVITIRRFDDLMIQQDAHKNQTTKLLTELVASKQQQEDLLQKLTTGMISANTDIDKRLDRAQSALRTAAEQIAGTAPQFVATTAEALDMINSKLSQTVRDQLSMLSRISNPVKWGLLVVVLLLLLDILLRLGSY